MLAKFRLNSIVKLLVPFLLLNAASCSWFRADVPPEEPMEASLELFMSRSSITKTEFEHYKVDSGESSELRFFFECGEVRRGENIVNEGDMFRLAREQSASIVRLVRAVDDSYRNLEPKGDEEGNNETFADPGKFELVLARKGTLVTYHSSFDFISNRQGVFEEKVFDLVTALRSVPNYPPCSNKVFFGIPRKGDSALPN